MSSAFNMGDPSKIIMYRKMMTSRQCRNADRNDSMEKGSKLSSFGFMSPSKREITLCTYYTASIAYCVCVCVCVCDIYKCG